MYEKQRDRFMMKSASIGKSVVSGGLRAVAMPVIGGVAGYKASEDKSKSQRFLSTLGGATLGHWGSNLISAGKTLGTGAVGYSAARKGATNFDDITKEIGRRAQAGDFETIDDITGALDGISQASEAAASKAYKSPKFWAPMVATDAAAIGGSAYLADRHIKKNKPKSASIKSRINDTRASYDTPLINAVAAAAAAGSTPYLIHKGHNKLGVAAGALGGVLGYRAYKEDRMFSRDQKAALQNLRARGLDF